MRRVPLEEYKMPRIMTVDFTKGEVKKIVAAGFDVRRAYSGLYDKNEYCMPSALQDIEIALIKYSRETLIDFDERKRSEDSVLEEFDIRMMIKEIWEKHGWSVIFINEDTPPELLEYLGIEDIGLGKYYGRYVSGAKSAVSSHGQLPKFFRFIGETVFVEKENPGNLLFKFFKSGKWILLAKKEQDIYFWDDKVKQNWIIRDDSASQIALAIMLYDRFSVTPEKTYMHNTEGQKSEVELPRQSMGGILLLPDFGNKNVDIGLSLILEFFHEVNPLLFSEPIHKWLSDYRPESVKQLHKRIREIEEEITRKIEGINKKIQEEESKCAWIDMLLVGMDDDFKDSVGKAFGFLGFKVNDIDKELLPDERKREDFNLTDPSDESFYIVEAKSTKRGASEDFITKTQNHQATYSRKHRCSIPDAILIVNHSHNLEPKKRSGRFYTESEIKERLKDQHIKAIDSIVLHSLCQKVLAKKSTKEQAKKYIKNVTGACSNY